MGSDNMADSVNADFAQDVFSYSLNYYKGDYDAINYMRWNTASSRFEAYHHTSDVMDERNDLFNGNITAMATTISTPDTVAGKLITGQTSTALANAYRYDQLNRLAKSASFTNLDLSNNNWKNDNSTTAKLYRNAFKYDANGNITEQVKYDSLGVVMDSLVYRYEKINGKLHRNRLYHVNERASSTAQNYDIEDQLTFAAGLDSINIYNNYRYDEIGNLVHDSIEGIDTIKWTVYGKIKAIKRFSGSAKDNLYFDYDASGNRTAKHAYTSADVWKKSTYYVRDAQGNVMSTYQHQPVGMSMSYKLQEQNLYGSSRLGMTNPDLEMIGALSNLDTMKSWFGNKTYELSNHLGNVLTTISDRKIQLDGNSNTEVDGYVADISSSTDYYAFGQPMPGRSFNSNGYRYGFNGKENDPETVGTGEGTQDYGLRIYNPALGRFLSTDPLTKDYPWYSPYQFAGNKPIKHIDLDGAEELDPAFKENAKSYTFGFNAKGGTGHVESNTFIPVITLPKLNKITKEDVIDYIFKPFKTIGDYATMKDGNPNKPSYGENMAAQAEVATYIAPFLAPEAKATGTIIKEADAALEEGIIYKRKDLSGTIEKDYVGQAQSEARYKARQKEHARAHPDSDFEFEIIDRGKPGKNLDLKEQKHIDAGGGPTNKSNPNGGLSNKKNVIKKK
jgi:RHS repeat-associated protein